VCTLALAPSVWYLAGQVELPRRIRLLLLLRDRCALLPAGDCNQFTGTIQTERLTKSVGNGSNRAQFREVFRDFAPETIEASGGFHKWKVHVQQV
jgi:hypothetical protein